MVQSATIASHGAIQTEVAQLAGKFESMTAQATAQSRQSEQAAHTAMDHARAAITEARETHQRVENLMHKVEAESSQQAHAAVTHAQQALAAAATTQKDLSQRLQEVDQTSSQAVNAAESAKALATAEQHKRAAFEASTQKRLFDVQTVAQTAASQIQNVEATMQADLNTVLQQIQMLSAKTVKQETEYQRLLQTMTNMESTLEATRASLAQERATVAALRRQQEDWIRQEEQAATVEDTGDAPIWESDIIPDRDHRNRVEREAPRQNIQNSQNASDTARLQESIESLQRAFNTAMSSRQSMAPPSTEDPWSAISFPAHNIAHAVPGQSTQGTWSRTWKDPLQAGNGRTAQPGESSDSVSLTPGMQQHTVLSPNPNGQSRLSTAPTGGVSSSLFQIQLKPKEPSIFHGNLDQDIYSWIMELQDYLHLANANDQQAVAFTATLLKGIARDWWTRYLVDNGGRRPRTMLEMSTLLKQRFGSVLVEKRARAELRDIKMRKTENVRMYASRFEALLSKLASFDADWALDQFTVGLPNESAKLLTLARVKTLAEAIEQAEHIELCQRTTSGTVTVTANPSNAVPRGRGRRGGWSNWRGRGQAQRGRNRGYQQYARGSGRQYFYSGQQQNPRGDRAQVTCYQCGQRGHYASQCPQRQQSARGGAQAARGRARRGRPGRTILTLALGSDVDIDVQGPQDVVETTSAATEVQNEEPAPQQEN